MNKLVSAKIGIFFATAALLFSIIGFMLMNGSFAWFAQKRDASANGFSVTVKNSQSVTAELVSHPVTQINTATGEYTLDLDAESYELPIDDEYNISYSKYMKALAVIITVEATEQTTARLEIGSSSSFDTIISNDNFISNCIQISSTEDFSAGAETVQKGGVTKTFVNLSADEKKTGSITLGEYTFPQGQSEICFIIEYNDELLQYIGKEIMNGGFDDPLVTYADDIEFRIYA